MVGHFGHQTAPEPPGIGPAGGSEEVLALDSLAEAFPPKRGGLIGGMSNPTQPSARPAALLSLHEAAALLPHRPHVSALWRWARRGLLARGGVRIRLEHVRIGRRVLVTEAAILAFGEALARADVAEFEREAN